MKNLTAFIHNQNELSTVLGDDGPEILAEQEALQEKLESLRTQREDMRNLVDELNSINRAARRLLESSKRKRRLPRLLPSQNLPQRLPRSVLFLWSIRETYPSYARRRPTLLNGHFTHRQ